MGLDPDPDRIPGGAAGAARHCIEVIRQTAEHACCYKPNAAYWEQYGLDGWKALDEVRSSVPADIPVLYDAKRGDFGPTMRAYARAAFDALRMDAATVSPYLGADSLREFSDRAERGVYVICRTSNPGARDLQHRVDGGQPLYLAAAALAARVNTNGNVGLVVGATAPAEIAEVRAAQPGLPFLIPGVGAQGGDAQAAVRAGWNGDPASVLIASSRAVLYAEDPEAAARELRTMVAAAVAAA